MDKWTKIGISVVLGIVGIALATLWLGPSGWPFWAELAKFFPAIIVSIIALVAAHESRDKAAAAGDAAAAARNQAEAARDQAHAARLDQADARTKTAQRRVQRARAARHE